MPFTKGLDVIQQAQSGTGKTATFCAGILNNLDYQNLECQVCAEAAGPGVCAGMEVQQQQQGRRSCFPAGRRQQAAGCAGRRR